MITILPIENETRKNLIIQTIKCAEDNADVLVMSENNKELGYVAVDMKSSVIRMLKMKIYGCNKLSCASKELLVYADSLVKAAASYGSFVGAYKIESKIEGLENYLISIGFILSNGKLLCPLSNFVKFCKH